jgi:hypothetical protein
MRKYIMDKNGKEIYLIIIKIYTLKKNDINTLNLIIKEDEI